MSPLMLGYTINMMLLYQRLLGIIVQIILGFMLATSVISCSAFSSDSDEETVLESELDAEDELSGELNDVELTDGDGDLDLADDDTDGEDEDEDVESDEEEDLDDEVAENDLDEDDEEEDDEDDFDGEFADADDEDIEDVDDEDDFTDEDLETDEEALAKELGGKDEEYPENADAKPVFPEEVVQKEGAVPPSGQETPPTQPGVITSQTISGNDIDPPEPTIPQDDLGMADPIIPTDDRADTAGWVPVVKVKEDPFYRNSRLMNAVYIARPGDTIESISQKIYGEDKSQTLADDNSHLEKGVDPGDKVYYTSPNRPDDKTSLKIFYADKNLQPQKYTTKQGDNMRRLGSKLLGFSEGWKEVWAINPNVDSKTVLKKGTDLRYWTGDEQTAEEIMMAKAQAANPQQNEMVEPDPPVDLNQPPPPVVSELPPEPALPEASQAGLPQDPAMDAGGLPEPVDPLPEAEISQVPEEIPTESAQVGTQSDDSFLTIGVVGLLVLAGVALVAIQIKNRKSQTRVSPPSLEYTQV